MQNYPDDVINQLRGQLEKEKQNVAGRIAQLQGQDPFSDPDRANDNAASDTEANETAGHERMSALIGELEAQQTAIDAALTRMKEGTYGICSNCHKVIPLARLRILPAASLCLDCEGKT